MSSSGLRETIAYELAGRLKRLRPDACFSESHPHYVTDVAANLAPGVDYSLIRGDLGDAPTWDSGGLEGPDRICAVHSSIALAVNTFGPLKGRPSALSLLGLSGFRSAAFDEELPTGLGGMTPRLDFCAYGGEAAVAVEVAFTDLTAVKTANFPASYAPAVSDAADGRWAAMYRSLCSDPSRFRFLDAAQLVRDYLGLRRSFGGESEPLWLAYVFWEPVNWSEVEAYARHRYEVLAFAAAVSGGDVGFAAMSFAELWDAMEDWPAWDGRDAHLSYLRERYVFRL